MVSILFLVFSNIKFYQIIKLKFFSKNTIGVFFKNKKIKINSAMVKF